MEGCGDEGIYVCTPTLLPPTLPSCFLLLVPAASYLPLCISSICMLCGVHVRTYMPAPRRCQSVFEGGGAFIFISIGGGGREVIPRLHLWLESVLIMGKGRDKERRRKSQSAPQLKVQIDCGWLRFPASASPSLFIFCNISYLSLRAVTHTLARRHTQET